MKGVHYGVIGTMGALIGVLLVLVAIDPPAGETLPPRTQLAPVFRTDAGGFGLPGQMIGITIGGRPLTAASLSDDVPGMGYDLDLAGSGDLDVPRLFLGRLPSGLDALNEKEARKAVFFRVVLPLVLYANEEILADRERLWRIRYQGRRGVKLSPQDRLWLIIKVEEYRVAPGDLNELARRLDIVPPSVALAQAALESNWGTSALAQERNALFGQPRTATTQTKAVTSNNLTVGMAQETRGFDTLLESMRTHVRHVNVHPVYEEFRQSRAAMRQAGEPVDGVSLIPHLKTASGQRGDHRDTIRAIIEANGLGRLDSARLQYVPPAPKPSA